MDAVPEKTLRRWAESLAGVARTGLGFTESQYERERFEEILKIAGDIKAAADEGLEGVARRRGPRHGVDEGGRPRRARLRDAQGRRRRGGHQRRGELLLIQRADSGSGSTRRVGATSGYSAPEVVVKEVLEETGIEVEPVRLIGVLDGMRLGSSRIPLYSLLFFCRAVGGELQSTRSRCTDAGWFTRDDLPSPIIGAERWAEPDLRGDRRRDPRRLLRRPASSGVARVLMAVTVTIATTADTDLCDALNRLLPQLTSRPVPVTPADLAAIVDSTSSVLFVARDAGAVVGGRQPRDLPGAHRGSGPGSRTSWSTRAHGAWAWARPSRAPRSTRPGRGAWRGRPHQPAVARGRPPPLREGGLLHPRDRALPQDPLERPRGRVCGRGGLRAPRSAGGPTPGPRLST